MGGIQALAYSVVQSTDLSRWQTFAEQVLGMATTLAGGLLHIKMDDRAYRILVVPGPDDRYLASGWDVADAAAFEAIIGRLQAAGVAVHRADEALLAARGLAALVQFDDPSGNRHELGHGRTLPDAPFTSPIGVQGFVTDPYGLGHTVLPALNFEATERFFTELLGFGISDVFNFQPAPDAPVMRIHFLHAACGRHHSLALAEMPNPAGCVHMMVEVGSMTDVGLAHDRMLASGTKLMATLGEHENDGMTSFYMMTPGGFAIEYGWNGITVDPATHVTTEMQRVSVWGHDFSVGFR
ncbi:MAG: VOC family protein [Gammaproteobacteria bacterium]|nr:VOC family protein [Gammaproteobacteria bacterium]